MKFQEVRMFYYVFIVVKIIGINKHLLYIYVLETSLWVNNIDALHCNIHHFYDG